MILILKSRSYKKLMNRTYEQINNGWKVIRNAKKNCFGVWKIKLQKNEE